MGRGFAAEPVGDGGEDVGGDDEEGEVVLEEGAAEDHEEEADGKDLWRALVSGRTLEGDLGWNCVRRRGL